MYVWTGPWALVHEPTPLLRKLAGEFADRIARLWPAPHGAFLVASAERRHLICLALIGREPTAAALEPALTAPTKEAIRALLADAPEGLERALRRMGEEAWPEAAYRQLLVVLADPFRARIVNHAQALDPESVVGTANLPSVVARACGGRLKVGEAQARLLCEAFEAVVRRVGPERAEAVAARWGRAGSVKQLFEWAAEDILSDVPTPPFPTAEGLKLLATKGEIREAAIRYRNCLRSYLAEAVSGESVFFEWLGPPAAIVQVSRDPVFGWRLSEVRGHNNETVAAEYRPAILSALRSMGVGIGPSHWSLTNALEQAGRGNAYLVTDEDRLNEPFD